MKPLEKGQKTRRFSLVTYATPEEFEELLTNARHYAYIYHDKDGKEPHYHILCTFDNARTLDGLKRLIRSESNTLGEVMCSVSHAFAYLTHASPTAISQGKYRYSDTDIICDDVGFWSAPTAEESNVTFINDLLSLTPYQMACIYGRDYIRNYRSYSEFANMLTAQGISGAEVVDDE